MTLDDLIRFYHGLTPADIARFPEFYTDDAYFKDPFNEVLGVVAIQRVFSHMFRQVEEPRFIVSERVVDDHGAVLFWEFQYRVRKRGLEEKQAIRGVSHLKFDASGKVSYHRDYWDAAEELYMKLPLIGMLMRGLRRALAA
jgi:steroid delta-isomerase